MVFYGFIYRIFGYESKYFVKVFISRIERNFEKNIEF